jgi:hypothetical protein
MPPRRSKRRAPSDDSHKENTPSSPPVERKSRAGPSRRTAPLESEKEDSDGEGEQAGPAKGSKRLRVSEEGEAREVKAEPVKVKAEPVKAEPVAWKKKDRTLTRDVDG